MRSPPAATFLLLLLLLLFCCHGCSANVLLITPNLTTSFQSIQADFAPRVRGHGVSGCLVLANPLDACSLIESQDAALAAALFALTMRGNCSFDSKVRNAQEAGFAAVLVFDDEYNSELLTMSGSAEGIYIHAVFVSRAAGEALAAYADDSTSEIRLLPTYEDTVWSVVVFSFIAMLAVSAAVATCLIVRSRRGRYLTDRLSRQQEPGGMSSRVVKAMPCIIYKATGKQKATQEACAICLEDYLVGENLRILPCSHRFHSECVDTWLTMWRAFCPICKRDARLDSSELAALETTPLLNQRPSYPSGGGASAQGESPPVQIPPCQADSRCGSLDIPSSSQNSAFPSHHHLPPRNGSSIIASPASPIPSRQSGMQVSALRQANSLSSLDMDSLQAFRASPYFTPPSVSRHPSPLLPGSYVAPYLLDSSPATNSPSSLS